MKSSKTILHGPYRMLTIVVPSVYGPLSRFALLSYCPMFDYAATPRFDEIDHQRDLRVSTSKPDFSTAMKSRSQSA